MPRPVNTGIKFFAALGIALSGAAHAQNRQLISTSLTECSVIFDELSEVGERRGKSPEDVNNARISAALFLVEARSQARKEGRAKPNSHIQAEAERLSSKWSGRFSKILLLEENMDWIDYCRALGKNRSIALP